MSGKVNFNDEMSFQSFSKNHIFESNKDQNKICQNEIVEFSFIKNLFLPKSDDYYSSNYSNFASTFNEQDVNIYSKNDKNIQVSGHFGKSKYDSKKYKNILNKINEIKQPIFYIEEKYIRTIEEEPKRKNLNTLQNNSSTSILFNNNLKKIEIIRRKKCAKNNSTNNKYLNVRMDSFSSLRNKKIEKSYLYKKKISNNNIKLNYNKIFRDNSYQRNADYSFNKSNNNISTNETICNNKNEMTNDCNKKYKYKNLKINIDINKKIKQKENRIINNNSYLLIKNLKENKENVSNNNLGKHTFLQNKNMRNYLKNNNLYCPNFRDIKYINIDSYKEYKNIHLMNKSSNKIIKNNIDKLKNENRIRNKGNKIKNSNAIINTSDYNNSKMNIINNKSIRLIKSRTHRSKLEIKKSNNMQGKKAPTQGKKAALQKSLTTNNFENNSKNI